MAVALVNAPQLGRPELLPQACTVAHAARARGVPEDHGDEVGGLLGVPVAVDGTSLAAVRRALGIL